MKQGEKNSSVSYILSDQVWWCSIKQFWVASANLCKPIHDMQIFPLPFVLFLLENVEKKGKITKIWISWEQKSFLDEIKTLFMQDSDKPGKPGKNRVFCGTQGKPGKLSEF